MNWRRWFQRWPVFVRRGSSGSGNWGHAGRPGIRGGSAPGGGLGAIGAGPTSTPGERRKKADEKRGVEQTEKAAHKKLLGGLPAKGKKIEVRDLAKKADIPEADVVKHMATLELQGKVKFTHAWTDTGLRFWYEKT
jgi:hypothetical protein